MLRSVLAVVAGIVVSAIVVGIIEIPGNRMHPLPPGTDTSDWNALKSHAAKAPTVALIGVAIAWTAGPLVGGSIAATIARRAQVFHGAIVGTVFLAMDLVMLSSLPHPVWLMVVGVIGPVLGGWLGGELSKRFAPPAAGGPRPYDMREKNMAC